MRIGSLIFFFVLAVAGIPGTAMAQLNKPLTGKEYSTARKENFNGFIGENSNTVFSVDYLYLTRKKQELILRKFHKTDLQLADAQNIYETPPDGFYGEPLEVFYRNDTIYLFSNLFDETNRVTFITLDLYNTNYEKLRSVRVDTLPDDENLVIRQEQNGEGYILARSSKFSNLTEQEIKLKYINNTGTIDWQEKIKSPMALQNIVIEKICFAKDGPLYALCNYAYDPAGAIIGEDNTMVNNKYAIWAYDRSAHFLKEFEVRIKGKWINGIDMNLNHNHELVLGGFFNETRYRTICGTFSLILSNDLEIVNSSFLRFDDSIMFRFIPEKDRGKTKELSEYLLNDMAMLDNGSYFLLGERYYKQVERNYDPRTNITTTTEYYNYNDIIISYFDSLGQHLWTNRVPKFQNSTNDYGYFSSYTFLNSGEEIYLFFNDSDKNNELSLDDYFNYKTLFNNRRFQISYVQVGPEGPVSRGALLGLENAFMLRAKESHAISKSTMYLLGEVGREAKVFSVSIAKN
jgi:hypothetical protein